MKVPAAGNSLTSRIRELSSPLLPLHTGVAPRLRELSGIQAVLFDVYGTLLISASGEVGTAGSDSDGLALAAAMKASSAGSGRIGERDEETFIRAGFRGVELLRSVIEKHHRVLHSEGIRYPEVDIRKVWVDVFRRLKRERLVEPKDFCLDLLAVEYECRLNPVWPMPGVEKLFSALRSTDMALGIVSNAQFYTPLVVEALLNLELKQIGFRSDLNVWSYQHRIAKPSNRLLEMALAMLESTLGIDRQSVLYIGNDMRNDILPTVELHCRSALFAGDRRSYRPRTDDLRCRNIVADLIITDLTQLIHLLI